MERYRVGPIRGRGKKVLGSGSYSKVILVETGKHHEQNIALKQSLSWGDRAKFVQEITHLFKLQHPCVIKIYGWSLDSSKIFEIRMRYAENGSLDKYLPRHRSRQGRRLDARQRARLICDIVLGMRYVHSRKIVHGDLKPANILLDGNWRGLICDFGMSQTMSAEGLATREVGTGLYAAPEQLQYGTDYTAKVDVFAFGLILYEIIGDVPAFPGYRSALVPTLTIPDEFGLLMQQLIPRCCSLRPGDRPSFSEVFDEFTSCGFAIVPGADVDAIRQEVSDVLKGERGVC
jgi:serine/threonine protein kinase